MKDLVIVVLAVATFVLGSVLVIMDRQECPETDSANLNVKIAVLEGQLKAINSRYNDHGYRLQYIEDKMRIFNHE